MKKYKLVFVSLCFVFSITLFSNESINENPNETSVKNETSGEKQIVKNVDGSKGESQQTTPTVVVKKSATKKEEINETDTESKISNPKDVKKEDEMTQKKDESKEVVAKELNGAKNKKKETKENIEKIVELPEFSSIQVSGLTMCKGTRWYFEEYDEQGNMVGSVSYNRRKLLEKSSIEYSEGKKVSATFIEPSMIVKVRYNNRGVEIAREEFTNENGTIGKPLNSSSGVYDDKENLLEETKIENGVVIRHVYTYNGKEKATETIYEDDKQTLFIEYGQGRKTIHIFNEGVEVSVVEEETD